jgi:hypothetical protein
MKYKMAIRADQERDINQPPYIQIARIAFFPARAFGVSVFRNFYTTSALCQNDFRRIVTAATSLAFGRFSGRLNIDERRRPVQKWEKKTFVFALMIRDAVLPG